MESQRPFFLAVVVVVVVVVVNFSIRTDTEIEKRPSLKKNEYSDKCLFIYETISGRGKVTRSQSSFRLSHRFDAIIGK